MTFSIEYSEKYVTKYWGDRPGPTKPDIEYTNSYSYSKLDYEQFKT